MILKKQVGLVAFTNFSLQKFSNSPQTNIEIIEGVELLRAVELDLKIFGVEFESDTRSVDTPEDLEFVKKIFRMTHTLNNINIEKSIEKYKSFENNNFLFLLSILLLSLRIDYRFIETINCCGDDHTYFVHAETIAEDFDLIILIK